MERACNHIGEIVHVQVGLQEFRLKWLIIVQVRHYTVQGDGSPNCSLNILELGNIDVFAIIFVYESYGDFHIEILVLRIVFSERQLRQWWSGEVG